MFLFRPNFIYGGENAERGRYPFVAALGIRELSGRVNLAYYHMMYMYKLRPCKRQSFPNIIFLWESEKSEKMKKMVFPFSWKFCKSNLVKSTKIMSQKIWKLLEFVCQIQNYQIKLRDIWYFKKVSIYSQ